MATRTCSQCGATLRIPPHHSGGKGRCPGCGTVFSLAESESEIEVVELEVTELDEPTPEPVPREPRRRRTAARGARRGVGARDEEERPSRRRPARSSGRRYRSGGSSENTNIFVIGLLGLVLCGFLAPVAWVMGNTALDQCRRRGIPPDSMLTAGRIMGIIGTCLLGLSLLMVIFVLLLA